MKSIFARSALGLGTIAALGIVLAGTVSAQAPASPVAAQPHSPAPVPPTAVQRDIGNRPAKSRSPTAPVAVKGALIPTSSGLSAGRRYRFAGRRFCWHNQGWNGAGWYQCGFSRRIGLGWGGPAGWNRWALVAAASGYGAAPNRAYKSAPAAIYIPPPPVVQQRPAYVPEPYAPEKRFGRFAPPVF